MSKEPRSSYKRGLATSPSSVLAASRINLPLGNALPTKAPAIIGLKPSTKRELFAALSEWQHHPEHFATVLIGWLRASGVTIPPGVFLPVSRSPAKRTSAENLAIYDMWLEGKRKNPNFTWAQLRRIFREVHPTAKNATSQTNQVFQQAVVAAEKYYKSIAPWWEPEFPASAGKKSRT